MLNKKTLERINNRPRSAGPAPFVILAAVAVALIVGFFVSFVLAAAILLAGVAAGFLLYRKRLQERTIRLEYDLDEKLAARFAKIGDACRVLASSEEIVFEAEQQPPRPAEQEHQPRIEAGLLPTPGISTNVEVWGFGFPQRKLFFFPECALLYEDDRYRPLPYEALKIDFSPHPVKQKGEEVPSDADVFGHTWQHVKEDGSPDKRYRNNPRLTRVIYGLLELSGADGFEMRMRVSNRNAAMRFARVLGSELSSREPRGNGPNRTGRQQEIDSRIAYGILGLEPGAPKAAVVSAYRQLAKANHPDLVQHLSPRHREDAERRMRLLNAAYAELKHLPN